MKLINAGIDVITLFNKYAKRLLTNKVRPSISEEGIMTIPNKQRVEKMAENLYKDFQQAGVPNSILKTENDIKVFHHKIAEINNENMAKQFDTLMSESTLFNPQKSADVFDLKGKKIKDPQKIMGGEAIEESKNFSGELTSVPDKVGQSGLSYETKNKEAIQRFKDKMKKDPPEELATGGIAGLRQGYDAGSKVIKYGKDIFNLLKNKKKLQKAFDNIFTTDDYKMDMEAVAESLVELNPKQFKGKLYDDLPDELRGEVYGAAMNVVNQNNFKMRQLKKAKDKNKKLINISDPKVAEDFTTFIKTNDPDGYKNLEQKLELESFDPPKDRKPNATGGRAGYYGGGQAMVGKDLSDIGHGSDALMARNMQIAPGGQATTSTGLNYLLGQDNDTVRVPYKDAGPVVLPKPKPTNNFKSLLKIYNTYKDSMPAVSEDTQKYLAQDFINKLNEKGLSQTEFQTLRMQNHYEESKADGGRAGFSAGGFNAGRRGFLKLLGATTAGVAALKSGALKLLTAGKATSAIPKVISGTSGTPIWFENVVNKVLAEGIDATAKLAIKDGQIVKSLDTPTGKVDVYYDNKTGSVDLEYAGANTSMNEAVSMRYTPGVADEVTKGVKPADEFQASEVIPEFRGNAWDKRDRDLDAGENISNSKTLDDLYSDTSELSELGGEKLLIKDIAKTFKKKKELKTMNDNPEEFALENRYEPDYGDPMDYKE